MSTENRNPDPIAELLQRVGPRPEVPEERTARVKTVVRDHWQRRARSRSRRRSWLYGGALAAAATIVVAIVATVWHAGRAVPVPSGPVATVEAIRGSVAVGGSAPRVGESLIAGMTVETGAGGSVAFRLTSGPAVRVAHATRLSVTSESVLVLDRGTIYVDSGAEQTGERAIEVQTPFGVVHDIGTQFEVYSSGDRVRVRVREGLVVLEAGDATHHGEPGDELLLGAGGAVTRSSISPFDSEWSWTQRIAPPFSLEGRSLNEFLEWVSRESGRGVEFGDAEAASAAPSVVLHGSIDGLTAEQALAAVLPTCGMTHSLDDRILIEKGPR